MTQFARIIVLSVFILIESNCFIPFVNWKNSDVLNGRRNEDSIVNVRALRKRRFPCIEKKFLRLYNGDAWNYFACPYFDLFEFFSMAIIDVLHCSSYVWTIFIRVIRRRCLQDNCSSIPVRDLMHMCPDLLQRTTNGGQISCFNIRSLCVKYPATS